MFNTTTGGNNFKLTKNLRENLISTDFILEEGNQYLDDNVTLERWARTHRQKILMNISFESEVHNIYNPRFSSDECLSRSLSSIERSVY